MAVKGKKKSQTRGSQGRRRPSAAPRPVAAAPRVPFYRMLEGRIAIAIILALVTGIVWYAVASARSSSDELEAEQTRLQDYESSVGALLQNLTPPASEMQALTVPPEGDAVEDLAADSKRWNDQLVESQAQIAQLPVEPEFQPINQLLTESIQLFTNAAGAFALVPEADGKLAQDLFAQATTLRDRANAVWAGAVAVLDQKLDEAELDPSGLRSPGEGTPPAQPTTAPTPPPTTEPTPPATDGGGDGGGGDGGGNDSGGDGSGSG